MRGCNGVCGDDIPDAVDVADGDAETPLVTLECARPLPVRSTVRWILTGASLGMSACIWALDASRASCNWRSSSSRLDGAAKEASWLGLQQHIRMFTQTF